MASNTPEYITDLSEAFQKKADWKNAAAMAKYMKGHFPFFGITSPARKELYRAHWKKNGLPPAEKTVDIIHWLWNAPQREYQYFGMELMGKLAKKAAKDRITLYEYTITHKSWWDTVDYIAANPVGVYFRLNPEQITSITHNWMASGNIWLQRSCLLFQLKYKADTDTELLGKYIEQLSGSDEFFIRKAIGWVLREYSKTDPEYVIQFVNGHELSGLSRREALKWIRNKELKD